MKTIVLPGYSPHNKEWAYEVKEKLNLGHEIEVHEWEHWSGKGSLSLKNEIDSIQNKIGEGKTNFITKSVGTRALMHLLTKISKQINKVILCGIPTKLQNDSVKELYANGLNSLSPSQILIIQNKKDTLASSDIIKKFINSVNPRIKVLEKDRSDHNYPYFQDFQEFLE